MALSNSFGWRYFASRYTLPLCLKCLFMNQKEKCFENCKCICGRTHHTTTKTSLSCYFSWKCEMKLATINEMMVALIIMSNDYFSKLWLPVVTTDFIYQAITSAPQLTFEYYHHDWFIFRLWTCKYCISCILYLRVLHTGQFVSQRSGRQADAVLSPEHAD